VQCLGGVLATRWPLLWVMIDGDGCCGISWGPWARLPEGGVVSDSPRRMTDSENSGHASDNENDEIRTSLCEIGET
jgi:hypothetical protein